MTTEQHDQQAAQQSRRRFLDVHAMSYFLLEMSHSRRPYRMDRLAAAAL